jgi:fatty-acyl-CoA synthase
MQTIAATWVTGLTIGEVLRQTVEQHESQEAFVFPQYNERCTWREFYAATTAAAKALLALGIQKGEHIAIWGTNIPEWVILQFAAARIGVVLVTINPAYRPFELEFVLNQSNAVCLFLVDKFKSSDYFQMLREICPELAEAELSRRLNSRKAPLLRHVIGLRGETPAPIANWSQFLQLGTLLTDAALAEREAICQPHEAINIQYTSGTTGFPKAATLSHSNLLLNAFYIGECQRFTSQERVCIPVPFYHCFGCVLGTLTCAVYGATMVVPYEYFNALHTLNVLQTENCTAIYGVPTMFIAQLEEPTFAGRSFPYLRTGIMAGAPCPIEIMRQIEEKMNVHELTIAYGQTEASPVITQTRSHDPLELRVETVGRPLPGFEVKIIDPATGESLGDNLPGELCARGHGVMLGYYNNPAATALAIDAENWLHTGDLAVRLPNGYFKITGRLKDMVIRGGENVYPREIEEYLFTHGAIEQASVVGVPDPKYGEELCVWIKLRAGQTLTAEEVRQFCRAMLAHFKVPRYVKFVESFPQTVTGKIQKYKIREFMMQELGLTEQKTA